MPLPPNPDLDGNIEAAARSSDTAAVAYALLRVGQALDTLDGNGPKLIEALHKIAHEIEAGTRRIARAIRDKDGVDDER
jgi:hypothetical protein